MADYADLPSINLAPQTITQYIFSKEKPEYFIDFFCIKSHVLVLFYPIRDIGENLSQAIINLIQQHGFKSK